MELEGGLIEYTDSLDVWTSSGLFFDKRWILFPAASLITSLQEKHDMMKDVKNINMGQFCKENLLNINQDNTKVILQTNLNKLGVFPARFVRMFSCKNIRSSNNLPLVCGQYSADKFQETSYYILSLFIILDINSNIGVTENDFIKSLHGLLNICSEVKRGEKVFIESCPFGSRDLLGSLSEGVISNCFGEDSCYFLTDAATTAGCEGGLVVSSINTRRQKHGKLFGIVISSLNLWRGEPTGLTMGANLIPLLAQFVPQKYNYSIFKYLPKMTTILDLIDNSIVQIFCGTGWGTGFLVDKEKGMFATAAHVVSDAPNTAILVRWKKQYFPAFLIFKAKKRSAFDIAFIQGGVKHVFKMHQLKFSKEAAEKGERVLIAGYPIFNAHYEYFPTVSKGIISLSDPHILHTTCNVLSGNSGGPILKETGEILGIVACHTTISHENKIYVYPKINMGIPVSVLQRPLEEYLSKDDKSSLETLDCYEKDILNKWRLYQSKL